MIRRDETPLVLDEHPGGDNGWMLDTTAYLTLAGGYLVAIITSSSLTSARVLAAHRVQYRLAVLLPPHGLLGANSR